MLKKPFTNKIRNEKKAQTVQNSENKNRSHSETTRDENEYPKA